MDDVRVTSIEVHFIEDLGFTGFMEFPLRHMYLFQRIFCLAYTGQVVHLRVMYCCCRWLSLLCIAAGS